MLFPMAFAAGLYPRQAAVLVAFVALKLTLKSGLGYGHGTMVRSFQRWTPQRKE